MAVVRREYGAHTSSSSSMPEGERGLAMMKKVFGGVKSEGHTEFEAELVEFLSRVGLAEGLIQAGFVDGYGGHFGGEQSGRREV